MKTPAFVQGLLSGLALCVAPLASGQAGLPTSQPKMLTIVREMVKPGVGADHAKHEAGWPAAFEKANSPDYYLAMTSLTGPNEAWYVAPQESHATIAASMKREDKDATLSAELARLSRRDAEFITGATVIQLVGRPDLSHGAFPDTAKIRFFEVTLFTSRIGMNDKLENVFKIYAKLRKRAAPDSSYRVYSVIAGMPGPVYFVISSVDDYAKFDQFMSDHEKTMKAASKEEMAEFEKWHDLVAKEETQRFKVDPVQSYVPKETRAKDPEFWMPK